MLKKNDFSAFKTLMWYSFRAGRCFNANNRWNFDIYEQDKLMRSWVEH